MIIGSGKIFWAVTNAHNFGTDPDMEVLFVAGVASCYAILRARDINPEFRTIPEFSTKNPQNQPKSMGDDFSTLGKNSGDFFFG